MSDSPKNHVKNGGDKPETVLVMILRKIMT